MRKFNRLCGLAMCLVLVVASAALARTSRATLSAVFPGADPQGNLDYGYRAGTGVVRATYNDRRGTLRVIGRAVVENSSNHVQVYVDAGIMDQFAFNGVVASDVYRLSARGRANYRGLLVASTGL